MNIFEGDAFMNLLLLWGYDGNLLRFLGIFWETAFKTEPQLFS